MERLNVATDEINRLEVDLDEARNVFRNILSESSNRIENCSKKLGHSITKARPYYDSRLKAKEVSLIIKNKIMGNKAALKLFK